ncbi:MAG: hypothetical protein ACLQAT_31050 [Candidatus Binataceae bacterium]
MEQIRAFLPLSRWWLEHRLGISEPNDLMLIEADQDLPPEIRERDLLLVDRSAGNKLPRGEGLYVFSVPTGLAVRRVEVGLKRGFVVTGPGMSEELAPMEMDRLSASDLAGREDLAAPRWEKCSANYELVSIWRSRSESRSRGSSSDIRNSQPGTVVSLCKRR